MLLYYFRVNSLNCYIKITQSFQVNKWKSFSIVSITFQEKHTFGMNLELETSNFVLFYLHLSDLKFICNILYVLSFAKNWMDYSHWKIDKDGSFQSKVTNERKLFYSDYSISTSQRELHSTCLPGHFVCQ